MLFFKPEFNLNFYLPISYVSIIIYLAFARSIKILKQHKREMQWWKKNFILEKIFLIVYFIYHCLIIYLDKSPEIIEISLKEFFFGNVNSLVIDLNRTNLSGLEKFYLNIGQNLFNKQLNAQLINFNIFSVFWKKDWRVNFFKLN